MTCNIRRKGRFMNQRDTGEANRKLNKYPPAVTSMLDKVIN